MGERLKMIGMGILGYLGYKRLTRVPLGPPPGGGWTPETIYAAQESALEARKEQLRTRMEWQEARRQWANDVITATGSPPTTEEKRQWKIDNPMPP